MSMSMNEPEYQKNRKYAALGSLLFSAGVAALLLLTGLGYQVPPPAEDGVEVNLGNSDQGMGDIQPLESENNPQTASTANPESQEQYLTQDVIPEQVALPPKPTQSRVTQTNPNPDPQPVVNQQAMYPGRTTTGGSQGVTGQPGDQGQQGGNPNSNNYNGAPGPGGSGASWSLSGRKSVSLPRPSSNFSEGGVVVVKIWVDRNGKVVRALAGASGTTTNSAALRRLAEQAAMQATFNASAEAQYEQVGSITYNFRVN
jgi:hypothetical protein